MSPSRTLTQTFLALACLATLLAGLGLSRSLRICTKPCCAGHVKLTASCDLAATRFVDAPAAPG
ncbi:MAG: hypothetical protein WAT39_10270 [Planctomycetota bacterium]